MLPAATSRFIASKLGSLKGKSASPKNYSAAKVSAPAKAKLTQRSVLTRSSLPPSVLSAQYAVRGPLVVRAVQIEKALKKGEKFPFSRVTYCNVRSLSLFLDGKHRDT